MNLPDELSKLQALRESGALSEAEFEQAKARVLSGQGAATSGGVSATPAVAVVNAFRRSLHDRWLGGVCGGLGRTTGLESWVWRLIFVLLVAFAGTGVLLYLLIWIFVPTDAE